MNVYTFALPMMRNDGLRSYVRELEAWEAAAETLAGGFTDLGTHRGSWRDWGTGRVYRERMRHYSVMCRHEIKLALISRMRELFPDQISFYVAITGNATIYDGAEHGTDTGTPGPARV